jgi:hypothetical protein
LLKGGIPASVEPVGEGERRKARNETIFRQVNEQIERLQKPFALTDTEPLHIVCECDDLACAERIVVPVDVYDETRADAAQFFVRPGHEDEEVEVVVDTGGDYLIVRKRPGAPESIARATDPRDGF